MSMTISREMIMYPNISIIHVEDDPEWQELVREAVDYFTDLDIEAWLHVESLEDVGQTLSTMRGSVALIVHLQLGDGRDFSLDQILGNLERFLCRNASVPIFVVSGHINSTVVQALRRIGVPDDHLYGKDIWSTEQQKFADTLQKSFRLEI